MVQDCVYLNCRKPPSQQVLLKKKAFLHPLGIIVLQLKVFKLMERKNTRIQNSSIRSITPITTLSAK